MDARTDPRSVRPPADAAELHQRLLALTAQLDRRAAYIQGDNGAGVSVSATETRVAHGGRTVPKHVGITPIGNVTAWLSGTRMDATYVYLTASGAGSVFLEVVF